jgi:Radical SAM superfamily
VNVIVREKFSDPDITAKGERRARVPLVALDTLWFNTGTLCNITCANCYIESSPKNDRLAYLTQADVGTYLDEIVRENLGTRLIGFTGGEPFLNKAFPAILEQTLARGFETLTLTNAMKPLMQKRAAVERLVTHYGPRARFRVSLDDHRADIHDAERGRGAFAGAMQGLVWLASIGATIEVAGRHLSHEDDATARAGYRALFDAQRLAIDADDPAQLVIFPEMSAHAEPPEITEGCWGILRKSPDSVMCASSRMVVKRKDAAVPTVLACTLIPYDDRFDLGATLVEATKPVALTHRHCATFCVLGGAACGTSRDA